MDHNPLSYIFYSTIWQGCGVKVPGSSWNRQKCITSINTFTLRLVENVKLHFTFFFFRENCWVQRIKRMWEKERKFKYLLEATSRRDLSKDDKKEKKREREKIFFLDMKISLKISLFIAAKQNTNYLFIIYLNV